MARKKSVKVGPEVQYPGVYVTSLPRGIAFGKSIGPASNLRPAGPHKSNIQTRQEVKAALAAGEEE